VLARRAYQRFPYPTSGNPKPLATDHPNRFKQAGFKLRKYQVSSGKTIKTGFPETTLKKVPKQAGHVLGETVNPGLEWVRIWVGGV